MNISASRAILVGLALLVALAVWVFRKTGAPQETIKPPRPSPRDVRRTELLRARKDVLRQIERHRATRHNHHGALFQETLEKLKAVLAEIDAELKT